MDALSGVLWRRVIEVVLWGKRFVLCSEGRCGSLVREYRRRRRLVGLACSESLWGRRKCVNGDGYWCYERS